MITEVTRRSIFDAFIVAEANWSGRLSEPDFLARLYNLKELPSYDYRYSDAAGDIWKHRVMNSDWDNDWIFYDSRFNLLQASDEEFLNFLCEMLHPVVRPDTEDAEKICSIINQHLSKDGYQLAVRSYISGKPVYSVHQTTGLSASAAKLLREVEDPYLTADYVTKQINRMESSIYTSPDLAIGTAKELIESVCKTLLKKEGIEIDSNTKMPKLAKQALDLLNLVPSNIQDAEKGNKSVSTLLGNLTSLAQSVAELRNIFGSGHGKEANTKDLKPWHAKLAVGAASTFVVFLLEAYSSTPKK